MRVNRGVGQSLICRQQTTGGKGLRAGAINYDLPPDFSGVQTFPAPGQLLCGCGFFGGCFFRGCFFSCCFGGGLFLCWSFLALAGFSGFLSD